MRPSEVAELLIIDAGLNRFASSANQSAEKAVAWAAAINVKAEAMPFEEARELVVEHYASTSDPLTPFALIEAWERRHRRTPAQIAADVRSAKARGIVRPTWPRNKPLLPQDAARLAEARAAERPPAELEGPNVSPLSLDVGRRV